MSGSTLDEIADHVVRLVSSAVAEDTVALLRKFKEEKGQHDRAASGVTETMAALAQAKVEVFDVKTSVTSIGYVEGAGDRVPEALRQLGLNVSTISSDDFFDLSLFANV